MLNGVHCANKKRGVPEASGRQQYGIFIAHLAGNKCVHEDDAITVEVGVMHERNTHLPAKCVLNVVADFKPSRGVETYSEAVYHASVRDGVDLVSHKAKPA